MRQERQGHRHSTNLLRVRKREGNRQEKQKRRLRRLAFLYSLEKNQYQLKREENVGSTHALESHKYPFVLMDSTQEYLR